MYFARNHTATVRATQVLPYRCPSCGHAGYAQILGVGQGHGHSPFLLNESGAKQRAASKAEEAAYENARLTLKLATCPACGARDKEALRGAQGKTFAGMAAFVIGCALIGLAYAGLSVGAGHGGAVGWIIVAGGPLCAFGVWRRNSWKWTDIDHRITFLPKDYEPAAATIAEQEGMMRVAEDVLASRAAPPISLDVPYKTTALFLKDHAKIATGSLFVRSAKPFPAGRNVILTLSVPGIDHPLVLRAWVSEEVPAEAYRGRTPGMTLQFDLDDESKASLASFSARVRALDAPVAGPITMPVAYASAALFLKDLARITTGALFVRTKKPFPAGAAVLLSVTVSGIDDRLALRAQVGEGGAPDTEAGMTLHFDLDAPTRTSLDSFAACVRATLPAAVGRSLYLPGLR